MEKITNKIALEVAIAQMTEVFDKMSEFNRNCVPGEEVDCLRQSEIIGKLGKMLEQVEKKSNSGKSAKPSKAQLENQEIKNQILVVLQGEENPLQIKEMLEKSELSGYTNQKISALVRQLVSEEKVERVEEKKVARFKIK